MIARAMGVYCSAPVPILSAIGIMPMMVASEVIRIGRNRTRQAVMTASAGDRPLPLQIVSEINNQNAVRVCDTDQHQHAHQRHYVQCAMGERQDDQHADKSHGDCKHNQQGIDKRLELSCQNKKKEDKRKQESKSKTLE